MKIPSTLSLAFLLVGGVAVTVALPRYAESRQTQGEMNAQAVADYRKADGELNRAYGRLQEHLDATANAKLKKAQRAWVAFRDAEMAFAADGARGGSLSPYLRYAAGARITRDRVKDLNSYLEDYKSR